MLHSPTQELIRFIHSLPSCNLRPEAVRQVQADQFERIREELKAKMASLIADQEKRDLRWAAQVDELNRQLQAAADRGGGGWCSLQ